MPITLADHFKQFIWRYLIYPIFPFLYRTFASSTVLKALGHEGYRQKYHLGWLEPGRTLGDFVKHIGKLGFSNHFVAWKDHGQAFSLRKRASFEWQYHLRIFSDGEVCGHYEKTPESHPIDHFFEAGEVDRREDFYGFFGEWLVHERPAPSTK